MRKILSLLIAVLVIFSFTAAAQSDSQTDTGLTYINPFNMFESFVEAAEVELAGLIGGEELKAKALANNAEESLAKAERLRSQNKTEQAEQLSEKYQRNMNRSKALAEKTNNQNLSKQLENISNSNTERLKQVKQKTPEKAQKGLNKAINNLNNSLPDKVGEDRNLDKDLRENLNKTLKDLPENIDKPEKAKNSSSKPDLAENFSEEPAKDVREDLKDKAVNKSKNTDLENTTDSVKEPNNISLNTDNQTPINTDNLTSDENENPLDDPQLGSGLN